MKISFLLILLSSFTLFHSSTFPQGYCDQIKTEQEIKQILIQLRDSIVLSLPQNEIQKIKNDVLKYPVNLQENKFCINFNLDQNDDQINVKLAPERKDWALALIGLEYTFLGGCFEGYSKYLDIGFWCFLEAALIHLEPNHLSNIGFHLNNKKKYSQAFEILCYANSLDSTRFEIHNNLSYSLASLGKVVDAFKEAKKSLNLQPNSVHTQKRFTEFANASGVDINLNHSGLDYVPDETGFGGGPPSPAFTKAFSKITHINFKMHKELQSNFLKYGEEAGYMQRGGYSDKSPNIIGNYENDLERSYRQYESCVNGKPGNVYCKCELPQKRRDYASIVRCYEELSNLTDQWDMENYILIEATIEEMVDELNKAVDLTYKERAAIYNWILEQREFAMIQFEVSLNLMDPYWYDIESNFESVQQAEKSCVGFVSKPEKRFPNFEFGKRPGKLIIKRFDKGRPWHINLYFVNMKLNPDGFSELSFGYKALKGKFKYDFETGDYGSGIGIGINVSKQIDIGEAGKQISEHLFDFDLSLGLEVDSKNGIQPGFGGGIEPKIGIYRGDFPTVSIPLLN